MLATRNGPLVAGTGTAVPVRLIGAEPTLLAVVVDHAQAVFTAIVYGSAFLTAIESLLPIAKLSGDNAKSRMRNKPSFALPRFSFA